MKEYGCTVEFVDAKRRTIEILIEDEWPHVVIAKHNGNVVGKLEFTEYEDCSLLEHANVEDRYQKAGIGTQMFRELLELADDVLVPNRRWDPTTNHQYYFSGEGRALINACMRLGILTSRNEARYNPYDRDDE